MNTELAERRTCASPASRAPLTTTLFTLLRATDVRSVRHLFVHCLSVSFAEIPFCIVVSFTLDTFRRPCLRAVRHLVSLVSTNQRCSKMLKDAQRCSKMIEGSGPLPSRPFNIFKGFGGGGGGCVKVLLGQNQVLRIPPCGPSLEILRESLPFSFQLANKEKNRNATIYGRVPRIKPDKL